MIKKVRPWACSSLSSAISCATSDWFSPAITSSSSTICGCKASARATSSRRRSDSVRSPARRAARCAMPTRSSTAMALSRATLSEASCRKAPIITFSNAFSAVSGLAIWKVRPMPSLARACGGSWLIAWPRKRTSPSVGASWPVSRLKKVVLPAPLGPMMLTISPRFTDRLTLSTARKPPNCLATPVTSSSAGLASALGLGLGAGFMACPGCCRAGVCAGPRSRRPRRAS